MHKHEMGRVPGFTAEEALGQEASAPYGGLARGGAGSAVEPAYCRPLGNGYLCCYMGFCNYVHGPHYLM
jgi:hypothetical protein